MRVEGWESLLASHIQDAYRGQFAWGTRDCALWCADWVLKATGEDLGAPWRGKYKTAAGATRLMKKKGFACPEQIADAVLTPCPVPLARRGDIVLDGECLGICNGRHSYFVTADSVTTRDTLACSRAWRVGG